MIRFARNLAGILMIAALLMSSGCRTGGTTPALSDIGPAITPVVTDYELIRDVEYGQGGGHPLLLDIYRPLQPIATPTPAVIWIHGGGWAMGQKYPSMVALLAKAGFFCVSIDFRLSGEAEFPAAVEDCKCAVRWLRANASSYDVDPDAIGVWGDSSGGHLSMMVGCADAGAEMEGEGGWDGISSRVQAVCSYYGPTDLTLAFGFSAVDAFLGVSHQQDPDAFRRASPVYYVTSDDPPLLMVHGEKDMIAPLSQSKAMLAAYRKLKLEAELIIVKNAGHGFYQAGSQPISPSRAEYEKAVLDFFVKNL